MRALIVSTLAAPEGTNRDFFTAVIAGLRSLGIDYNRSFTDALSAAQINSYDLVVCPQYASYTLNTQINDATVTKPFFFFGNQNGAAGFGTTPGITGSLSSNADQFFTASFSSSPYLATFGKWVDLDGGTPIIQSSATDAITGGAQAQSGKVLAWGSTTAGGSGLYASSAVVTSDMFLHVLIEQAVQDGYLAVPPRRAPVVVDLDHPNGTGSTPAIPSTIDNFMKYIPTGGVTWGGLSDATAAISSNLPADTVAELIKWQSTGKLKLCDHHHSDLPTSGNFPNAADTMTKLAQETLYDANKVIWNGLGLTLDIPGFFNPPDNSWNEDSLALYSNETSKASDGADTASQAGYGFVSFRNRGRSHRAYDDQNNHFYNTHHAKQMMRGIMIHPTYDQGGVVPMDTAAKWRDSFRYINVALFSGMTLYMHDDDFVVADQDPGVNKHGAEVYRQMLDMHNWMTNTAKFWADPVDYVINKNFI